MVVSSRVLACSGGVVAIKVVTVVEMLPVLFAAGVVVGAGGGAGAGAGAGGLGLLVSWCLGVSFLVAVVTVILAWLLCRRCCSCCLAWLYLSMWWRLIGC